MKVIRPWFSLLALAASFSHSSFGADTLALWTFENPGFPGGSNAVVVGSTLTGIQAEQGNGVLNVVHSNALTAYSFPTGNGSAQSLGIDHWTGGDYMEVKLSTVGYTNIILQFDRVIDAFAPTNFSIWYATNGEASLTRITTDSPYFVEGSRGPFWNPTNRSTLYFRIYNFTSVKSLANQPDLWVRVVDDTVPLLNGVVRFDNLQVSGTPIPIPEPCGTSFCLVALVSAFTIRRRAKSAVRMQNHKLQ
jgi:hypothetical protein